MGDVLIDYALRKLYDGCKFRQLSLEGSLWTWSSSKSGWPLLGAGPPYRHCFGASSCAERASYSKAYIPLQSASWYSAQCWPANGYGGYSAANGAGLRAVWLSAAVWQAQHRRLHPLPLPAATIAASAHGIRATPSAPRSLRGKRHRRCNGRRPSPTACGSDRSQTVVG